MNRAKMLTLLLLLLPLAGCRAGEESSGSYQSTLKVTGPVMLKIESGAGGIQVHTGPADAVYLVATIRVRDYWSESKAQDKVKKLQTHFPLKQNGNQIDIGEVDDPDLRNNVFIDYDLTVPAQTQLTSVTGAGGLSISGTQLGVDARTGAGQITVRDVGGDVRLQSGAGGIRVYSIQGELVAESGAGQITVEAEPKHDWRLHVGAGGIRVRVPIRSQFNLEASAGMGHVRVSQDLNLEGSVSRSHVEGRVGKGGPTVRAQSGAGSIDVE